ncbi:hypothetical protein AB1N83_014130 [Pleurotus pulmonarius]
MITAQVRKCSKDIRRVSVMFITRIFITSQKHTVTPVLLYICCLLHTHYFYRAQSHFQQMERNYQRR